MCGIALMLGIHQGFRTCGGGSALAEMATHVMYLGGHGEKTTSTLEFKDTVKARFGRRSESDYYGTSGMNCIHNDFYQDEEAGNDLGEKGMI